ncbi:MAG: kelch repeat-containing protein, partial [Chloroflexota bacterium]
NRILRASEIYDPATDRWTDAAPLPRGRTEFSTATLPDGRVLVAGGFEEDGRMSRSTLIYDPRTDSWTEGPAMLSERLNHVMTRLPSGDLLFFGGEQNGAGTAERYEWRSRTFSYAGTLGAPRLVAQGVALPDGRVLAVGGLPQDRFRTRFAPIAGAEIWDPATARWSDVVSAPTARAYGALVVTERGIFRVSGSGPDELAYSTIEALVWK